MSVRLVECGTHVFEAVIEPDDPGYIDRTITLRRLSGPPLTEEQWGRLKQAIVRGLIAGGCRVYRVCAVREGDR